MPLSPLCSLKASDPAAGVFRVREEKKTSTFCVWTDYFLWTLYTLCPKKTDLGKPGTPPSPGLQGPRPGSSRWTVCCGRVHPAHTRPSLGNFCQPSPAQPSLQAQGCLPGFSHSQRPSVHIPKKEKYFQDSKIASGLSIQQSLTSTPFPGERQARVLPGSRLIAQQHWTPKPSVLPPLPSSAGQLRSSQDCSQPPPRPFSFREGHTVTATPRNSAQPGTTPSAPTQTHQQRPG